MKLSVIISPWRCEESVIRVIYRSTQQTLQKEDYEIIIVDRTPSSFYGDAVEILKTSSNASLEYLVLDGASRARASNTGLRKASNEVTLFLAEDFVPSFNLFQGHLAFHRVSPAAAKAVSGVVVWDPCLPFTDLRRWLELNIITIPQIPENQHLHPLNTGCANFSVKKKFLEENGFFDEDYHYEAYDDIDLAVRLNGAGLTVTLDPKLIAYHDDAFDLEELTRRWRFVGRSARLFDVKHPNLRPNIEPQDATQAIQMILLQCAISSSLSTITGLRAAKEYHYLKTLELAFIRGYNDLTAVNPLHTPPNQGEAWFGKSSKEMLRDMIEESRKLGR
ncbi:MAG: glycosyltransferase [Candidatus Bathyarchaeia archaeon]|jgi:GT2 family glycosyltransferase